MIKENKNGINYEFKSLSLTKSNKITRVTFTHKKNHLLTMLFAQKVIAGAQLYKVGDSRK